MSKRAPHHDALLVEALHAMIRALLEYMPPAQRRAASAYAEAVAQGIVHSAPEFRKPQRRTAT